MATAKSDDEAEERQPHPLAQNRPGVYVQVVATPRKRKGERTRLESDAAHTALRAEQSSPVVRESPDEDTARESGVEPSTRAQAASVPESLALPRQRGSREDSADADSVRPPSARPVDLADVPDSDSENTNHRADMVKVPGPPRMPSISLSGAPLAPPREQAASLLDAPRSLRPESLPSQKNTSWGLLAFVATLSAIITAAAVVALREKQGPDEGAARVSARAPSVVAAPSSARTDVQPVQAPVAPASGSEESAALAAPAPASVPAQAMPAPAPAAQAPAPPPPVPAVRAVSAPRVAAAVQPLRKPAPAPAVRPAVAAPAPSADAPAAAPGQASTPAQIIAEHARALAPVELPASVDTSLPPNPYEAAEE